MAPRHSAAIRRQLTVRAHCIFHGEMFIVATPNQFAELCSRHRRAKVVALILITAHGSQRVELFGGFHTFGHYFESQAVCQGDDRLHDGGDLDEDRNRGVLSKLITLAKERRLETAYSPRRNKKGGR